MDGFIWLGKEASFGFNSFKKPRLQRALLGFLLNHFWLSGLAVNFNMNNSVAQMTTVSEGCRN